jgi:hypothetical protein
MYKTYTCDACLNRCCVLKIEKWKNPPVDICVIGFPDCEAEWKAKKKKELLTPKEGVLEEPPYTRCVQVPILKPDYKQAPNCSTCEWCGDSMVVNGLGMKTTFPECCTAQGYKSCGEEGVYNSEACIKLYKEKEEK